MGKLSTIIRGSDRRQKRSFPRNIFLFDSCFCGIIFKTKALPETPPAITEMLLSPVRQFITAGDAEQEVPAKSVFTPAFVDAIRYGTADLNKDKYITGTELGLYLRDIVPKFAKQIPQYGKSGDYDLSTGSIHTRTILIVTV